MLFRTETLHEREGVALYRAHDDSRGAVVVKLLDPRHCARTELDRLKNEYEVGRQLDIPSALKPLALESHEGMPALVMEGFDGESLDRIVAAQNGAPMEAERFLAIAVRITAAVAQIHRRNIVHKDLKPENILVARESSEVREVRILDFGIAASLPREPRAAQPPGLLEGSLPYVSPEQTGRTSRVVDCRSDLYSLGVTFYEMLTGHLPFQAGDALEWVHCHLARTPPPPSEIVTSIPSAVSSIVMKLLAKMAEDRYQSAAGLKRDLETCISQLHEKGHIEPFALGRRDVSERFQIPQRLYGREREIALLGEAFESVVFSGTSELVVVVGPSGSGKSSLVRELSEPVSRAGIFASGKSDREKADVPYSTIMQAFRDLARAILTESEARVQVVRGRLRTALGINARLVVEMIPEMELVIGPQPPLPELPLTETKGRFRMVFRQLVSAFAEASRPLVIFVDDLQWADPASLDLIVHLCTHPEVRHVLVVGAHRVEGVAASHALPRAIENVRTAGTRVTTVSLSPLSVSDVSRLLADTLRCGAADATPLAALIHQKTAGSPFFIIQFLTMLHGEALIEFDPSAERWTWDVRRIEAKAYTDNVVDLMVSKLRGLPPATQEVLCTAAYVGNIVDPEMLGTSCDRAPAPTIEALARAVREGLLLQRGETYMFLHDRFREAAYLLVPENERIDMHLRIGRMWLACLSREAVEERVFDVVHHFEIAMAALAEPEERDRVAALELAAGRKAKASAAWASAVRYLRAASSLLSPGCWTKDYRLAYSIHLELAQCEWLAGDFSAADDRLLGLLPRARGKVDLAEICRLRIEILSSHGELQKAVDTLAAAATSLFDVEFPIPTTREHARLAVLDVLKELGDRPLEELLTLPEMSDPEKKAEIALLGAGLTAGYYITQHLHELMVCRIVLLSLRHGNADASVLGWAAFGTTSGRLLFDWEKTRQFTNLGLELARKRGADTSRLMVVLALLFYPRSLPLRDCVAVLRQAWQSSRARGDLTTACNCAYPLVRYRFAAGEPLADIEAECEEQASFTRVAESPVVTAAVERLQRLVTRLRGGSVETDAIPEGAAFGPHSAWAHAFCEMQRAVFFGDSAAAMQASTVARAFMVAVKGTIDLAEYAYFAALAMTSLWDSAPSEAREELAKQAAEQRERLRLWADRGPATFRARHELVAAEVARIGGAHEDAARHYEVAIRAARENGLLGNEALAYEIAARFYRAQGFTLIADTYLQEARFCYARWGADGKVAQLDAAFPQLTTERVTERIGGRGSTPVAVRSEQLDLSSVLKASQTISGELLLDRLLETLIRVVMEQSGAQRGFIILARRGELAIEAEAGAAEKGELRVELLRSSRVESAALPASIVRYTWRTREMVLLDDAAKESRFASDEYIARAKPRSVLCLPILRRGEPAGVLYLENDLVAGAFTKDRLAVLEVLASQAAISLENALLLENERAAREAAQLAERRTAFLAEATVLLTSSLDFQVIFERLVRLVVRDLAEWCVIDAIEVGELRRLAGAHADPAKQVLVDELHRRYPMITHSSPLTARVIRTGRAVLAPEISDEQLRASCVDDEHARMVRAIGLRTGIVVPLLVRGEVIGSIGVASAKPGRRFGREDLELVQELARRAAIALDNARLYRETQKAVRLRDEFLTAASHELKTPMTSLGLTLEGLLRLRAPPEAQSLKRLVERAREQADRMNRLVDDLLDVSQVDTGTLPLEPTEVDLGGVVRDAIASCRAELVRMGSTVSFEPVSVRGRWDAGRIRKAVYALLSNAAKFGAGKPIEVAISTVSSVAKVSVTDHGVGIEPERRAHVFDRFERLASIKQHGGLGLGLYIARGIVEAHGGSIHVDSEPGVGSTFTIELPVS